MALSRSEAKQGGGAVQDSRPRRGKKGASLELRSGAGVEPTGLTYAQDKTYDFVLFAGGGNQDSRPPRGEKGASLGPRRSRREAELRNEGDHAGVTLPQVLEPAGGGCA